MKAIGNSVIGMKRTNNEDAIYVNEQKNLYVVADGMGGCNAGEVASNTAISIFVEAMEKTENEEIDLVCCNVSQDSTLWELGTIILAEYKNWQSKIEAKIVRNLAFLMEKKGVNSILLFTKKGITKGAQLEINKCAAHNKYILVFSLDDLYHLNDKKTSPYDLLISKINTLKDETLENSVMEMIM